MSIPKYISLSVRTFKPKLKYTIGDLVYSVDDIKRKKLMVIVDFIAVNYFDYEDYLCLRISNYGKIQLKELNEKELIKIKI